MPQITARVETAMLGWHIHQVVRVEATDYTDKLIGAGRLTVLEEHPDDVVVADAGAVEVEAELGPNSGPCPVCEKPVAHPLLEGHLRGHELRDEGDAADGEE